MGRFRTLAEEVDQAAGAVERLGGGMSSLADDAERAARGVGGRSTGAPLRSGMSHISQFRAEMAALRRALENAARTGAAFNTSWSWSSRSS